MSRLISGKISRVFVAILVTMSVATVLILMENTMAPLIELFVLVIGVIVVLYIYTFSRAYSLRLDKSLDELSRASKFLEEKKIKIRKSR